jgi:hypothetical protein
MEILMAKAWALIVVRENSKKQTIQGVVAFGRQTKCPTLSQWLHYQVMKTP